MSIKMRMRRMRMSKWMRIRIKRRTVVKSAYKPSGPAGQCLSLVSVA